MPDVMLTTEDGESLEAELLLPANPRLSVVITHPHPLHGGSMHTPVPGGFFNALKDSDVAALRFNFRGVGRSTGTHDEGGAERLDVAAAIEHLAGEAPHTPIVLAGWSFGADVSLTIDDDRIAGWFLAAPPLRIVDLADMAARASAAPKVLAIGTSDQFNPPAKAIASTEDWTNTTIEPIDGADHFFGPTLSELIEKFADFIGELATD